MSTSSQKKRSQKNLNLGMLTLMLIASALICSLWSQAPNLEEGASNLEEGAPNLEEGAPNLEKGADTPKHTRKDDAATSNASISAVNQYVTTAVNFLFENTNVSNVAAYLMGDKNKETPEEDWFYWLTRKKLTHEDFVSWVSVFSSKEKVPEPRIEQSYTFILWIIIAVLFVALFSYIYVKYVQPKNTLVKEQPLSKEKKNFYVDSSVNIRKSECFLCGTEAEQKNILKWLKTMVRASDKNERHTISTGNAKAICKQFGFDVPISRDNDPVIPCDVWLTFYTS